MERYENLGLVGEGSYGMVLKCRHKETNQIVAIKKFIESEDDKMVKKIAMREIRMLKQLRHENLVNLLEVFRRKKRLYLVFEFVDRTVLDDLEKKPDGLDDLHVKKIAFQVLRGLEFCHSHNIIHRDVKPENILVSKSGIVKLCDFGFARTLTTGPGELFTDYVATRWYRAPELLVGDLNYGKAVDVWAVGCLLFELITGDPLFPGDSDIDQLFHITKHLGNLTQRHLEIFHRNPLFTGMRLPNVRSAEYLKNYKELLTLSLDLILKSLALEASQRPSCLEMMKHRYFDEGDFAAKFLESLKEQIEKETVVNPLLKSIAAQKLDNRNNSKENKKEKRNKERQESLPKSLHESKKKKEPKIIKENSVANHPPMASNTENNRKATVNDSNIKETNMQNTELNSNQAQNNKLTSETEKVENANDRINAYVSMSQAASDCRGTKQVDVDRSDTKLSLRMPFDVSINSLGKNLPDISFGTHTNRAHGHEVKKQAKIYKKKVHNKHSDGLSSVSEKSPSFLEHKSIEELSEKFKKETWRDISDIDLSKRSGLHLPSVKAKSMKASQSRGGMRKHTTIPHIQNIDPFSPNSSNNTQESPTGNGRSYHRDDNLPAV